MFGGINRFTCIEHYKKPCPPGPVRNELYKHTGNSFIPNRQIYKFNSYLSSGEDNGADVVYTSCGVDCATLCISETCGWYGGC